MPSRSPPGLAGRRQEGEEDRVPGAPVLGAHVGAATNLANKVVPLADLEAEGVAAGGTRPRRARPRSEGLPVRCSSSPPRPGSDVRRERDRPVRHHRRGAPGVARLPRQTPDFTNTSAVIEPIPPQVTSSLPPSRLRVWLLAIRPDGPGGRIGSRGRDRARRWRSGPSSDAPTRRSGALPSPSCCRCWRTLRTTSRISGRGDTPTARADGRGRRLGAPAGAGDRVVIGLWASSVWRSPSAGRTRWHSAPSLVAPSRQRPVRLHLLRAGWWWARPTSRRCSTRSSSSRRSPVGALTTAILVVNNLRDIPTDTATGKRTLAVVSSPAHRARVRAPAGSCVRGAGKPGRVRLAAGGGFPALAQGLPLLTLPLAIPLLRTVRDFEAPRTQRRAQGDRPPGARFGLRSAGLVLVGLRPAGAA